MTPLQTLLDTTPDLQPDDLDRWIAGALVTPVTRTGQLHLTDPDRARVHLLCILRYTLEIDVETVPVVLSLIDQLYATRQQLRALATAVAAQDSAVQQNIVAALPPASEPPDEELEDEP